MTEPLTRRTRETVTPAAPQAARQAKPTDAKTLLATLRITTTIGAVGLTLAGRGLLAHGEAVRAAQDTGATTQTFAGAAAAIAAPAGAAATSATGLATPTATAVAQLGIVAQARSATAAPVNASALLPTATPTPAATATSAAAAPTALPATATPATLVKLDVVEWVTTRAGDPVAVVKDSSGVLWYVWGTDVTRIEQGLAPEYQPQAVNAVSQSRAS